MSNTSSSPIYSSLAISCFSVLRRTHFNSGLQPLSPALVGFLPGPGHSPDSGLILQGLSNRGSERVKLPSTPTPRLQKMPFLSVSFICLPLLRSSSFALAVHSLGSFIAVRSTSSISSSTTLPSTSSLLIPSSSLSSCSFSVTFLMRRLYVPLLKSFIP